jgi:lipoate-protein ligase A
MQLVRSGAAGSAALELAVSHALLTRVAARELPSTLRVYRPAPAVAFGKLDTLRAGYGNARDAATQHGFEPVLRLPGGHAAAYHRASLAIDVVWALDDPVPGTHSRFADEGERLAVALKTLGVDARVGEVAGEYCPGAYSVNAAGARKLSGIGQRMIRGGAHVGAVVVVSGEDLVTAPLVPVYKALELEWDPATSGSVAAELGRPVELGEVIDALVARLTETDEIVESGVDDETLALAHELVTSSKR